MAVFSPIFFDTYGRAQIQGALQLAAGDDIRPAAGEESGKRSVYVPAFSDRTSCFFHTEKSPWPWRKAVIQAVVGLYVSAAGLPAVKNSKNLPFGPICKPA